ncbi:MAG: hypothetical protein IJ677_03480 [Alphaproteobacteria bacterium]|nr:hypothetical protein [Alphaproteobacteria bacterium]
MICKKIGIDFHGVLNTNPSFFRDFCHQAINRNIEIHLISGGPRETIAEFAQMNSIKYTKLWCIFDYFNAKNEVKFLPDGSFHVDDENWNKAKAQYCLKNNINVQIDDSHIYKRYFITPYCLYDEHSKTGIINGEMINFSHSAKLCLEKICDAVSR